MASWICGSGDDQPAAFLITNLDDDTTVPMCQAHLADFCVMFIQAWGQVNAPDDAQPELTPETTEPTAEPADPSPETPTRRPRKSRTASNTP